jgi:hypothetical protein
MKDVAVFSGPVATVESVRNRPSGSCAPAGFDQRRKLFVYWSPSLHRRPSKASRLPDVERRLGTIAATELNLCLIDSKSA